MAHLIQVGARIQSLDHLKDEAVKKAVPQNEVIFPGLCYVVRYKVFSISRITRNYVAVLGPLCERAAANFSCTILIFANRHMSYT